VMIWMIDQHLNQVFRSIIEDLKDKQSPRHEDGTKPDTRVAKKQRERRFKGASDPSYSKA
jgi:hypothetical protein